MSMYGQQIAETIIQQMGGAGRLKAMVGANSFIYGPIDYKGFTQPFMAFKFKMNPKIKSLRVIYEEGKDTYVMQFLGRTGKVISEIDDVYCDDLIDIFEQTTGLYLRLF